MKWISWEQVSRAMSSDLSIVWPLSEGATNELRALSFSECRLHSWRYGGTAACSTVDFYRPKRGNEAHAERQLAEMAETFLFTSESVGDGHPGTPRSDGESGGRR